QEYGRIRFAQHFFKPITPFAAIMRKFRGGFLRMKMQIAVGLLLATSMLAAQNATDSPDAHVAAAKAASGDDYQNLFNFVCAAPGNRGGGGAGGGGHR